jgi:hypothetical protein
MRQSNCFVGEKPWVQTTENRFVTSNEIEE